MHNIYSFDHKVFTDLIGLLNPHLTQTVKVLYRCYLDTLNITSKLYSALWSKQLIQVYELLHWS